MSNLGACECPSLCALLIRLQQCGLPFSLVTVQPTCRGRTKPEGAKLMPGEVVALKGLALSGNGLHISTNDIKDPAMLPVDKHPYITASKEVGLGPRAP